MGIKAYIAGLSGLTPTSREAALFTRYPPWGFILFSRNIGDYDQVRALTSDLRNITGRADTPILIDQEGGRVQRLRPPNWPSYPPARLIGEIYARDHEAGLRAAFLNSRLIAFDLHRMGINVDCMPVLDVPIEGADDVIGDRAYSYQPYEVAQLGRAACEGLLRGGVLPVIKHIPGHGRAFSDSHKALPVVRTDPAVLGCTDFYPFMQLADMPLAMTAHVVFSGFDAANPATHSKVMIGRIIRGWLGYDGLLMSDDLSMHALSGDFGRRARSAFGAGCDIVLHCNGVFEEMSAVAKAARELVREPARRAKRALERLQQPVASNEAAYRVEFARLVRTVS